MPTLSPTYVAVVPDTSSVLPLDVFTYSVPEEIAERVLIGSRVEIPFGSRDVVGYVVGRREDAGSGTVKSIAGVLDDQPLLSTEQISLASWVAQRYCAPLGEVIKAMIPSGIRSGKSGSRKARVTSKSLEHLQSTEPAELPLALNEEQRIALAPLLEAIAGHQHRRVLLHGVTGSGKTEIYLQAIAAAQAQGKQSIVLVPEIALTPQTIRRFGARFPGRVAVSHSALTDSERAQQWRRVRAGEVDVVVGSRSAVFAPVMKLGVVVVDEEDANAYKQDRVPRYHAVEVALELARLHSAPIVLGSATPRVETFYRAHRGELELANLTQRINGRPLPPIEVVDLREELNSGNRSPLSRDLQTAMQECYAGGGQMILFLNRRGTATVILCRSCGEAMMCPHCSVSMVYHHGERSCSCHYCGEAKPIPKTCANCGSKAIRGIGMGTERLEHEVAEVLPPQARLLRMDRDTTKTRDSHFSIYEAFRAGEADCLIGTQMVAKGWDLDRVQLVGIVNADTSLHLPDYRSGETTFSMLTQVAGRAGRGDESARVVLQTYSPDHYAIKHAVAQDYLGFAREEIRYRKMLKFPPYTRMVVCTVSNRSDDEAQSLAEQAAEEIRAALMDRADLAGIELLGPSPAFMHRLRGDYRWELTLRGEKIERIFPLLPVAKGRSQRWSIDVDPAA